MDLPEGKEIMCMVCNQSLAFPYLIICTGKWVHEGCSVHVKPIFLEGARKIERPRTKYPDSNRGTYRTKSIPYPREK